MNLSNCMEKYCVVCKCVSRYLWEDFFVCASHCIVSAGWLLAGFLCVHTEQILRIDIQFCRTRIFYCSHGQIIFTQFGTFSQNPCFNIRYRTDLSTQLPKTATESIKHVHTIEDICLKLSLLGFALDFNLIGQPR